MKCGLVGPSYQQISLPFDAQRCVNQFALLDQNGKDVASLLGTPGNNLFGTVGTGPGRGGFKASNGRAFVVSGSGLFEIQVDGSGVLLGSLDQSQGLVTIDENGFQLAVCDGASLYIFTYATNAFIKVVNANLALAKTVTFIDSYFVVNVGGGKFQISGNYDGTSWAALDFATAESSPDDLLRVLNVVGQLWLQGAETTEIWSNTGAVNFPFAKIAGAKMETGTGAVYSGIPLDNSAFWIGNDKYGFGIVNRATGFTPERISTDPIEKRIQAAPDPTSLRTWAYQEDGHTHLIISGGGMETALCYDLATKLWHERAFLNEAGLYELPLATYGFYAFNKHLVLDKTNGNIYEQRLDFYDDNGSPIARDRIFTHIFNEFKRQVFKNLVIGFETGVGLQNPNANGDGVSPEVALYLSDDGGKTFGTPYIDTIGEAGKFKDLVKFDRLGQASIMTFRTRRTDPCKYAVTSASFNVDIQMASRIIEAPAAQEVIDKNIKITLQWLLFLNQLSAGDPGAIFVPAPIGLTIVGSPIYTGAYYQNNNWTDFWININHNGGNSTSVASTSYVPVPFDVSIDGTCFAVANNTGTQSGMVQSSTKRCYLPPWSAVGGSLTISGRVLSI